MTLASAARKIASMASGDISPNGTGQAPALPASKKAFDIGEFELDIGRSAMIALPGMRRRFHLPEQGVHFFAVQASAGSHGAMTGHGAANVFESFFEDETVAEFR